MTVTTIEPARSTEAFAAPRWRWIWLVLLSLVVAVGFIARLAGTWNDLWLDEIISVQNARALDSVWDVFTRIHSDNNHYLNSVYLYLVRNAGNDHAFRYFSVACGVLTIVAGYWSGLARGRMAGVVFATLLACSYPLIHFSSEARGYAGMILGCVVALGAALRWLAKRSIAAEILYGVGISFAVLSHLTACLAWAPMAAAMLFIVLPRKDRISAVARWAAMNVLPALVLCCLYFADLRYTTALGGPEMSMLHGLSRLTAMSLGWPLKDSATPLIVVVPVLMAVVWELWRRHRSGDPVWLIIPLILLMPVVCALALRAAFFMPRYFLFALPFLYFVLALLAGELLESRKRRIIGLALLLFFLCGQTYLYMNFVRVGRGHISTALRLMANATPGPFVNVASSQDFRGLTECRYFQNAVGEKRVLYLGSNDNGWVVPEWYVLHQEGYDPPGEEEMRVGGQVWYRAGYFGASELSGQAWTVYSPRHVQLQH